MATEANGVEANVDFVILFLLETGPFSLAMDASRARAGAAGNTLLVI